MSSPETDAGESLRYFEVIEEEFVRLRGAPLLLSPSDWDLAASWQEQGIPLPVVVRALRQVFDTAASRRRRTPVHSLAYCRHAVTEEFAIHCESRLGGRADAAPSPARPPAAERLRVRAAEIDRLSVGWPVAAQAAASMTAAGVRRCAGELDKGTPAAEVEGTLANMEAELLEALEAALPPGISAAERRRCEEQLEPFRGRMSSEAYRRTGARSMAAALRRRFGLHRLSLLSD